MRIILNKVQNAVMLHGATKGHPAYCIQKGGQGWGR